MNVRELVGEMSRAGVTLWTDFGRYEAVEAVDTLTPQRCCSASSVTSTAPSDPCRGGNSVADSHPARP